LVKAVVLLATLLLGLLGAVPAQAAEARVWVFLLADRQGATDTYIPTQQDSSQTGVQGRVTRLGPGGYRVDLAGAGAAAGIPMVTAVNSSNVHCQLTSFAQNGTSEVIYVGCYAGEVPTNSKFTLSFFESTPRDSGAAGAYGYVFDNQPALATYANPPGYNSTGQPIEIYRTTGNSWTVRFFGDRFRTAGGNVQVTPVGTVPARCAVTQWSAHSQGADAQVRCDRPNGGAVTPQWTLTYTDNRSIVGGAGGFFGYLQADRPTSPSYTPSEPRNRGQDGYIHTVTRSGTGKYQVQLNGPVKAPVAMQLSVNGNTDNYCVIVNWSLTGGVEPAARVNLSCFAANGSPADSQYLLNYFAS
jgi:hypothetical protein